ncbi:MAG: sulfite exporter TauE/SafE family protein [Rhodobacteraceae bacterium]|nr:sulfite exporter TauE/SafE family protein [Paracoccaceae bacterium]
MPLPLLADALPMLALLLFIGALAGVLAGLLGVGGGIVLVPAFFYAFTVLGYDNPQLMQICLATSLATIVVTSIRSVLGHARKGAVDFDILKSWGPGIVVGALAGVATASMLRSEVLVAIFGVLALVVGLYMALGRSHWRLGPEMPRGVPRLVMSPSLGFLSVLMGIGGGSFGVPLMTLYNRPIHRAVATAAGFGLIIAVPSVAVFLLTTPPEAGRPPFMLGMVNLVAFGVVIAMTLLTTPLGVRLAHAMDPTPLKRVFAVFLILVALNMLRKVLF